MPSGIEEDGFALVPGLLDADERQRTLKVLGPRDGAGRRGVLAIPWVADLARSERLLAAIRPHLPAEPFPVRAIFFHKSPEANWLVPWHQDLTIAVREQVDLDGFGPWSVKEGIPHVQPPTEYLEAMLTIRLHLDDADATNGALRVLPGSHRLGRLSADQIAASRERVAEIACVCSAGDALLMRPLLLHASAKVTSPRHRRVLHIEYAGRDLPGGLAWYEAG